MSNFDDPKILKLMLAVLLRQVGNTFDFSQEDLDSVAFGTVNEYELTNGSIRLELLDIKKV